MIKISNFGNNINEIIIFNKFEHTAIRPGMLLKNVLNLKSKEYDVIDMLLAEIKNSEIRTIEINISKYFDSYKITNNKNLKIYQSLKEGCDSLFNKKIAIIYKDDKKSIITYEKESDLPQDHTKIHFFDRLTYSRGRIFATINRDLIEIFCEMKKRIFYNPKFSIALTMSESKNTYYYLKAFEDTKWCQLSLEEYCELIGIKENSIYRREYKELSRKIKKIESDINLNSDLQVTVHLDKKNNFIKWVLDEENKKSDDKKKNTEKKEYEYIQLNDKLPLRKKILSSLEQILVHENIKLSVNEYLKFEFEKQNCKTDKNKTLPGIRKAISKRLKISDRTIDNYLKYTFFVNEKILELFDLELIKNSDMDKYKKLDEAHQQEIAENIYPNNELLNLYKNTNNITKSQMLLYMNKSKKSQGELARIFSDNDNFDSIEKTDSSMLEESNAPGNIEVEDNVVYEPKIISKIISENELKEVLKNLFLTVINEVKFNTWVKFYIDNLKLNDNIATIHLSTQDFQNTVFYNKYFDFFKNYLSENNIEIKIAD